MADTENTGTEGGTPEEGKKKSGRGMGKINVVPKNQLSKEELREALDQYETIQTELRAIDAKRLELKKDASDLVRLIVEDVGNTRITVNGKLYKPGKHGENYFFISPDAGALDLDA